ncbi:TPA: hypothetical protein ACPY0B_002751 [Citrobacter farmeri]|uniref:hypothetical protein n=1 Tax=Citrobacter braakii TaxID=57706 RepID=UPI000CDD1CDC|nr:hypothetical protein [Citrobacter braakii]EGT0664420.1 hypothetical protein [Citrobacter werkmanii]EHG1308570.1 hypothetical protein [Salmonella enterica]HBH7007822.1 hypothetical protein [Citrobacter freundii]EHH6165062.1 hypothetical protein [Salmonella enterica]EHO7416030.1 hypothetical protein [Salmonella enterica]
MKRFFMALTASLLFTSHPSLAGSDMPVKVKVNHAGHECYGCIYVTVTAKTDTVLIKKIDVNRGKCPMLTHRKIAYRGRNVDGWWPTDKPFTPRKMTFADSVLWRFGHTLDFGKACNFVEARVFTDQGTFTVSQ